MSATLPPPTPRCRRRRRIAAAANASLPVPLIFTHGTPRLPPSGSTGRGVCPPPARRDAAFAPLRLDGTPRLPPSGSTGRRVCPPPARLRAPPSRRLPLKGGVILERLMQALYHSPLEGESQKPSRQAKADAVGGGRRPRLAACPAQHQTSCVTRTSSSRVVRPDLTFSNPSSRSVLMPCSRA